LTCPFKKNGQDSDEKIASVTAYKMCALHDIVIDCDTAEPSVHNVASSHLFDCDTVQPSVHNSECGPVLEQNGAAEGGETTTEVETVWHHSQFGREGMLESAGGEDELCGEAAAEQPGDQAERGGREEGAVDNMPGPQVKQSAREYGILVSYNVMALDRNRLEMLLSTFEYASIVAFQGTCKKQLKNEEGKFIPIDKFWIMCDYLECSRHVNTVAHAQEFWLTSPCVQPPLPSAGSLLAS